MLLYFGCHSCCFPIVQFAVLQLSTLLFYSGPCYYLLVALVAVFQFAVVWLSKL